MNEIYLRRRARVYVKPGQGESSIQHVASLQEEVELLGFVMTAALMDRLRTLDPGDLNRFLHALVADLRKLTGAHRPHKPLYPGFPEQVMRLSEAELFLNAIHHYLTLQRLPDQTSDRPALLNGKTPRTIDLGSKEDFEQIFTHLAGSSSSLSQQDKEDLTWFVRQYRAEVYRLIPAKLPFKENLALLGAQLLRHVPGDLSVAFVEERIKTPTDVLRLAVALADGDVSLVVPAKFGGFTRAQRRVLLGLLERSGDPTEDMLRWAERWKRLGERLHPGEFADRFPRTFAAFQVLREDLPYETFNRNLEALLEGGDADTATEVLSTRPGELARRLDHLLRLKESTAVVERFASVAQRVSTPVLLQVLAHFRHRDRPGKLRVFLPKGEVAKVFATANARQSLPVGASADVVGACEQALLDRFARLGSLGKCFVDPVLSNYIVPLGQRSASKSLRTLTRGTRLPMPPGNCVRLFLWWMNGRGRADVDLSVVFYGPRYEYVDTLAYYNLKGFGAYHSGDIVDAPKGAAEFIDLDLQRLEQRQVRFVVMVLNSYTAQPYCDLPECFAGWMARAEPKSGEVFEPRTVVDRVDIGANTRICLPLVLDLEERQLLWADLALKEQPRWNNVQNNLSGVSLMLRALQDMIKPNLQTLFTLHARARGMLVTSVEEADTVFAPGLGITPFEVDRIRADFL
jgi:hypothetical protein